MEDKFGVNIPGAMRDLLNANGMPIAQAIALSQMLDEKLMQADWLRLYNGKQFECAFDPEEGKPNANRILYCMTQTGNANNRTGQYYIYVTRTRDGKTVGGFISGNNGSAALHCLCGGHEGYCYSERDVPTRQFNGGIKGLPYLGCAGKDIAAAIIDLFNQSDNE